jgi:hypothetical protein
MKTVQIKKNDNSEWKYLIEKIALKEPLVSVYRL